MSGNKRPQTEAAGFSATSDDHLGHLILFTRGLLCDVTTLENRIFKFNKQLIKTEIRDISVLSYF